MLHNVLVWYNYPYNPKLYKCFRIETNVVLMWCNIIRELQKCNWSFWTMFYCNAIVMIMIKEMCKPNFILLVLILVFIDLLWFTVAIAWSTATCKGVLSKIFSMIGQLNPVLWESGRYRGIIGSWTDFLFYFSCIRRWIYFKYGTSHIMHHLFVKCGTHIRYRTH